MQPVICCYFVLKIGTVPSNVQVYIVGGVRDGRVTIDVHNSKRLEHMTVNAMKLKVNRPHVPYVELEAVEVYS